MGYAMMKEQNNPSIPVEEPTPVARTFQQPDANHSKDKNTGTMLSMIAIMLVIVLGAGGYYHSSQLAQRFLSTSHIIQQQLDMLKQSFQQERSVLEGLMRQQSERLDVADQEQATLARQLNELQGKVASLSSSDAKPWLLAQADFLVKMAGRKLWSDQDIICVVTLLKSADTSLAEMNDPSLLEMRQAIFDDIDTLSNLTQVDFDGITIRVNQLSNQVDNLRLVENNTNETLVGQDSDELSSSFGEWRQNLSKSWHNFMADFITIRHRDTNAEPLLAPNQDIYLRENIRSRLLVAAQAILRHQNETYKQSLETISTWVRAYFNTTDPVTKAFLEELDTLSQQPISMDLPERLKSQPLLDKVMKTRLRNLIYHSPAVHQER
jgi:uroporphyrin-3 C-methyltransferase